MAPSFKLFFFFYLSGIFNAQLHVLVLYLLSNLKLFGIFIKLKCILPPYLAVPNQQRRKNEAKPAPVLVREAIKENEPERMPPPPALKGQKQILYNISRVSTDYL